MVALNILIVTGFSLDDPAGGVNTMIHALRQHLAADCRVVLLENDWNSPRPALDDLRGAARYRLRLRSPYDHKSPVRGAVGWLASFPRLFRDLLKILRRERVDVIHLHYAAPYQYVFRLLQIVTGIPYVMTLHRGDIMTFPTLAAPDRALLHYAVRHATKVISVSRWLADQARSALGELSHLEVIENGVDLAELDALYDPEFAFQAGFEIPPRFFLMVSNVVYYKAQDVAIRAWALVQRRHPGLRLLIVGQKRELWDQCVQLIAELKCGEAVTLLGSQPRAVAVNLMKRATALIMPSRSEGLPYALLEAGALGLPVICSDIGPFTEVITNGDDGLVTPVEDHEALAAAVLDLLDRPDQGASLGHGLACRVRSDFSAERMARRYLSVYAEARSGAARR